jgi:hypothetical protein
MAREQNGHQTGCRPLHAPNPHKTPLRVVQPVVNFASGQTRKQGALRAGICSIFGTKQYELIDCSDISVAM